MPRTRTTTDEERFWSFVDKSGECWMYTGPINKDGYGEFVTAAGMVAAHRFAFELEHGPIPAGVHIRRNCRHAACVRGAHHYAKQVGVLVRPAPAPPPMPIPAPAPAGKPAPRYRSFYPQPSAPAIMRGVVAQLRLRFVPVARTTVL